MVQKNKKMTETLAMGTHMKVLGESFPMNTNVTGFQWFFENICVLVIWMKEASALEGLTSPLNFQMLQTIIKVKVFSDN